MHQPRENETMSTYMQEYKRTSPAKYRDMVIAGGSYGVPMRNMIRALESMSLLNTPVENDRLKAAKRLRRNKYSD